MLYASFFYSSLFSIHVYFTVFNVFELVSFIYLFSYFSYSLVLMHFIPFMIFISAVSIMPWSGVGRWWALSLSLLNVCYSVFKHFE